MSDAEADLTDAINRLCDLAEDGNNDNFVRGSLEATAALLRLWIGEHMPELKMRNRELEADNQRLRAEAMSLAEMVGEYSREAKRLRTAIQAALRDLSLGTMTQRILRQALDGEEEADG